MSRKTEIIAAWEKDPDQWFTAEEMDILIETGCIKDRITEIL